MPRERKTSRKIGEKASKILKNPRSKRDIKKVAGSALSQRAPKKRRK